MIWLSLGDVIIGVIWKKENIRSANERSSAVSGFMMNELVERLVFFF